MADLDKIRTVGTWPRRHHRSLNLGKNVPKNAGGEPSNGGGLSPKNEGPDTPTCPSSQTPKG